MVYEFWTDPGKSSAIPRLIVWSVRGKHPVFRIDTRYRNDELHNLPDSWTHTTISGEAVILIHKYKVDAVEVNVPINDTDYTIPVRAGMLVQEYEFPAQGSGLNPHLGSQKTYRVAEDGTQRLEGKQKGFTTFDGVELPPETGRRWFWWVVATASMLLVVGSVLVWRRVRQPFGEGRAERDVAP
jgi:hypothetical protein